MKGTYTKIIGLRMDFSNVMFDAKSHFLDKRVGESWLEVDPVTSFDLYNGYRKGMYEKASKESETNLFCITYCKRTSALNIQLYDLSYDQIPKHVKSYMKKNGYKIKNNGK